jgi:hypothetical protein
MFCQESGPSVGVGPLVGVIVEVGARVGVLVGSAAVEAAVSVGRVAGMLVAVDVNAGATAVKVAACTGDWETGRPVQATSKRRKVIAIKNSFFIWVLLWLEEKG